MVPNEHRRDPRYAVTMEVTLTSRSRSFQGKTLDFSIGGLRVRFPEGEAPRPNLEFKAQLVFPTGGRADTAAKVVWVVGQQAGLAFSGPAHPKVRAFAQLEAKRRS